MLTPNQLDRLPEPMIQLMSELQDEIISDICRRIQKTKLLTPTAEWQLEKANQLTISSREVKRRIASKLKVQEKLIKDIYTDAVKTAIDEDAKIYKMAIAEGILSDNYREKLTTYTRSVAFSNALKRGLKNTNGLMRNLTNSAAVAANRQLSDALDLAYLKVMSGAFTPQDAIFDAVKKLGADGLKCVKYDSGRTDQLDVAVRRAVVTGIGKTCCDMQIDLAKEMDCQLVEVSSHLGARPSHAEWQGQIYSLVKGHPKYPYFYDATGYGTGDGLGGWNCRHSFFPYFEGLSSPANAPDFTKSENAQVYADTQKQRAYERAIRKSKRELAALDGARSETTDPVLKAKYDREFERKSVTLKNREAKLNEHLKATGLLPDNFRVRVDGFGKSVSQKAVWAAKNKSAASTVTLNSNLYNNTAFKSKEYFESKEYKNKFKQFGSEFFSVFARDSVYISAREAILNNYGSISEDVSVINNISGIVKDRQHSDGLKVSFNVPKGKTGAYTVIHNHPNNAPLSIEDIVTASECKSIRTMMAAAHDGKIYWLQIGDGKRLSVTNEMLSKKTIEAQILKNEWARTISRNNGDFYKALQEFAEEYNWKVGVI